MRFSCHVASDCDLSTALLEAGGNRLGDGWRQGGAGAALPAGFEGRQAEHAAKPDQVARAGTSGRMWELRKQRHAPDYPVEGRRGIAALSRQKAELAIAHRQAGAVAERLLDL